MKKISCYIRQTRSSNSYEWKVLPWVIETYPIDKNNKYLHRRDFNCRNIGECFRIAYAVYGDRILMSYDKAAGRAYRKRWKEIFNNDTIV